MGDLFALTLRVHYARYLSEFSHYIFERYLSLPAVLRDIPQSFNKSSVLRRDAEHLVCNRQLAGRNSVSIFLAIATFSV